MKVRDVEDVRDVRDVRVRDVEDVRDARDVRARDVEDIRKWETTILRNDYWETAIVNLSLCMGGPGFDPAASS